MPNRKTFDVNDRYDHSSHSTRQQEPGDLQATPHAADASSAVTLPYDDHAKTRRRVPPVRFLAPSEEASSRHGASRTKRSV